MVTPALVALVFVAAGPGPTEDLGAATALVVGVNVVLGAYCWKVLVARHRLADGLSR